MKKFYPHIKASATVDQLGGMMYEVTVEAMEPYDYRRVYTLKAKDDNEAAFSGLDQFCEEVDNLGPRS